MLTAVVAAAAVAGEADRKQAVAGVYKPAVAVVGTPAAAGGKARNVVVGRVAREELGRAHIRNWDCDEPVLYHVTYVAVSNPSRSRRSSEPLERPAKPRCGFCENAYAAASP